MESKYPQLKVVFCDDDTFCLNIFKKLIEDANLFPPENIKYFSNPFQAKEFILTNEVNAIIVDYCMPGIDGRSLISEIKEENPKIKAALFTSLELIHLSKESEKDRSNIDIIIEKMKDREKIISLLIQLCDKIVK